jgi:hypothetical protein
MKSLEPPHPSEMLNGKYIRFKYTKQDACEIPCLRLGRIITSGNEDYLIEQLQPEHGIRKFKRHRIICFEIVETKNDTNSDPNLSPDVE